jgi:hypothetical protein
MWSGRLHTNRHPGQVMDIVNASTKLSLSLRRETYKYILVL